MKLSFFSVLLALVAFAALGYCFMVNDPIESNFFKALSLGAFLGSIKCMSTQR